MKRRSASGRRRGRRALTVMMAIVLLLLLAEGALVATIFVSPSTADRLRGVVGDVERAWNGSKGEPGLRTKMARGVSGTFHEWVTPLWETPKGPDDSADQGCPSCHRGYAAKRRFTSVYMDHPRHAELGLACADCHPETTHPNPPPPEEAVCARCHREVRDRNKCILCHPPASLPHFYLLGAPREGAVECDSCHRRDSFTRDGGRPLVHLPAMDGTDQQTCESCHPKATCTSCHGEPHPEGWGTSHGAVIGFAGESSCFQCHTSTYCADRCHSVTSTLPFYRRPLPLGDPP